MRAIFGLGALLICIGIVVGIWAKHTSTVSQSGNQAKDVATQLSGKGAMESIKLADGQANGRPCLEVISIDAGGPMEKVYGLQKGDQILEVGTAELEASREMLLDAYEKNQPINVLRAGKPYTLPLPASGPGAAAPTPSIRDQINNLGNR